MNGISSNYPGSANVDRLPSTQSNDAVLQQSEAATVEVKPQMQGMLPSFTSLKQTEQIGGQIAISDQQVLKAIERAIKAIEGKTTSLQFSIHERTKHISVKVLDKDTGEIIREIPPEKNLDFLANLWEKAGILVDERR